MVPSFMLPGSGLDAVNTRGVEIPRSAKLKAPSIPVLLTINRRCVSTVLKTELRSTSGPRICVFILEKGTRLDNDTTLCLRFLLFRTFVLPPRGDPMRELWRERRCRERK